VQHCERPPSGGLFALARRFPFLADVLSPHRFCGNRIDRAGPEAIRTSSVARTVSLGAILL
jgi:hypothetical protein